MQIKLKAKFTDLDLDKFIASIYINYKKNPTDDYLFDLSEVEHISNQELLVFTALLKTFIDDQIKFKVQFVAPMVARTEIPERVLRQIVQIWEVWKIYKLVPDGRYENYFDIDGNFIKRVRKDLNYTPKNLEIYNRHGITPFIDLDYINNYDEEEIEQLINPIYKLNSAVEEILAKGRCHHPFTSQSLSKIVTEELYLNFLDHAGESSFKGLSRSAFLSISFLDKFDDIRSSEKEIQSIKSLNFRTEELPESRNFYFDSKTNSFRNRPLLQFSFLDFGLGIPATLRGTYIQEHGTDASDNEILKYALQHFSSRHPILDENHSINKNIPRGIFDAITIIQRYSGLAIIRSGHAKVVLDFSSSQTIEKAYAPFGEQTDIFPGTLISFYIPAIEDSDALNTSVIKPEIVIPHHKPKAKQFISINNLVKNEKVDKSILYNSIISKLRNLIADLQEPTILYMSFAGWQQHERRVIKKLLYFLASDYSVNIQNNVVVMDGPSAELVQEVSEEIMQLSTAIKNYKIHPLPLINYDLKSGSIELDWLGIYDDGDRHQLNQLLYAEFSLAKSDFGDPSNLAGHHTYFDKHGNLISHLPNGNEIEKIYFEHNRELISQEINSLLAEYNCVKTAQPRSLFLCNGNYYQDYFIDLSPLVNNDHVCYLISYYLHRYIIGAIPEKKIKYIGISASSQRMLKSLQTQNQISGTDYIIIDDEHNIENFLRPDEVHSDYTYVLICDVVSTGYLTTKVSLKLEELGATLSYVAVIVSTLSPTFKPTTQFISKFKNKIISLHDREIKKLRREEIADFNTYDIVRINPYTNIPIELSIDSTNFRETVLTQSKVSYDPKTDEINIAHPFLDYVDSSYIKIGFLHFNNLIHPYFFETNKLLSELSSKAIAEILDSLKKPELGTAKIHAFYPSKSGIESLNLELIKKALKNHAVDYSVVDRFSTPDGWRFPHNNNIFTDKAEDAICMILDDGSCSGDSLIQMLDEIAFYKAKEIILICFIGRLSDHKRELFSRLSEIRGADGHKISVSTYFVSHWHIPTYFPDENPNIKEKYWLKDLIDLQNTPVPIKKIAANIIKEISPKALGEYRDYKYLPKLKGTDKSVPRKELLLVRDEVGKVVGYRLFRESFEFFNLFMRKYSSKEGSKKNRYREIELLCATFIFEPYLYDKIKAILPDVAERIEEFVRVLIYDARIYPLLTYQWGKKDIVHLFFIVFKDQKLIDELTIVKFRGLIKFMAPNASSLNYVLYKLLAYFSIKSHDHNSKEYDVHIKELLSTIKEDPTLKELRKYYNYICTLPSREDLRSQIEKLQESYNRQNEKQTHDQRRAFGHNVSQILAGIREAAGNIESQQKISYDRTIQIISSWMGMLELINPILSFSASFKGYLAPYPYFRLTNKIQGESSSLRQLVGFVEDVLYRINEDYSDLDKLKEVDKVIIRIQNDVQVGSDFYQLIMSPPSNASEFFASLSEGLHGKIKLSNSIVLSNTATFRIPSVYVDRLIKDELLNNLQRHADQSDGNEIEMEIRNIDLNIIELKITNVIGKSTNVHSTGEGIKCLMLLSEFQGFGFTYSNKVETTKFIQTLVFNIK